MKPALFVTVTLAFSSLASGSTPNGWIPADPMGFDAGEVGFGCDRVWISGEKDGVHDRDSDHIIMDFNVFEVYAGKGLRGASLPPVTVRDEKSTL